VSDKIEVGDLVESIADYRSWIKPGLVGVVRNIEPESSIGIKGPFLKVDGIHPYDIGIGHVTADHISCFRKIHPDSENKATKVWDWNKEPVSGGKADALTIKGFPARNSERGEPC